MDFVSIGLSAILSAILFILLEFTIILPLFKKIVTKAVNDMVTNQLIPSVTAFVDSKVSDLTVTLTKSLFAKIKGMMGGRGKGFNSLIAKLSDPDLDPDDIDLDGYEPSTIDKILAISDNIAPILQSSINRGVNNGSKEKEVQQDQDKDSVQGSAQAFIPSQIRL